MRQGFQYLQSRKRGNKRIMMSSYIYIAFLVLKRYNFSELNFQGKYQKILVSVFHKK